MFFFVERLPAKTAIREKRSAYLCSVVKLKDNKRTNSINRKNSNRSMALLFKPFQSVLENKEGARLFYPRTVVIGNVDTDTLAQEIAEYSSLTKGDVKNTIDNLITVMTRHLQASESVTLDGLGTFRLTMRSPGKGAASAQEVTASQASIHVCFAPAARRNPDGTVSTRSLVSGVKCVRYGSTEDDQNQSGQGGSGEEEEGGTGSMG